MNINYSSISLYNQTSARLSAPESSGVYYCGVLNQNGRLYPYYIGRALGEGVSIRSRLLDHMRVGEWPDVTHFQYVLLKTEDVTDFEANEIVRFNPKYNQRVG